MTLPPIPAPTARVVGLLLLAVAASPAQARCTWDYVCDGNGNCRQVPLCDSTLDIPPPAPPRLPPLPPPSIPPLASPRLPPLGTQACYPVQRQRADGSWYWQEICE